MRKPLDLPRLKQVLTRLGRNPRIRGRVYLTGGTTAVLHGWRTSTIDIDLRLDTETEQLLRDIPAIKEELEVNVELASPFDFIPEVPGWRERSVLIERVGGIDFFQLDYYSQALAKLERAHPQDYADVQAMLERGLIDRQRISGYYAAIEPELYRFPAIDPPSFHQRVHEFVQTSSPKATT